jgi:hypothetical protein
VRHLLWANQSKRGFTCRALGLVQKEGALGAEVCVGSEITVKSERRVSEHRTSYFFKLIYIIRVVMDTEVVEFHIADRKLDFLLQ